MRIIGAIIFCAFVTLVSVNAQAYVKDISVTAKKTSDRLILIEETKGQIFGQTSSTPIIEIPALTSVKNAPKFAAVNFITGNRQLEFGSVDFEDNTPEQCAGLGYDKTECEDGLASADVCPYNPSYFKSCCDPAYKYNKSNCSYPMTISGDSCGGKYMCYCDRSLYTVTECSAPQVVSTGDSCTEDGTTYYAGCQCPSTYNQTCTEKNQQGMGTGCTTNGETKYTGCECKSGYTLTCTDMGPTDSNNYCLMNGVKYYNSCKSCPNLCTVAEADKQTGVIYEYEECSKKYCAIGCATNYVNWCTKPEVDCVKLGYTKSASQCPDGYLTCPYNAAAVFCEDKSSGIKCSDIVGCEKCEQVELYTNNEVCTQCKSGYVLNLLNHTCEERPLLCKVANCQTCSTDGTICALCKTGYLMQNGKCVAEGSSCTLPDVERTCNGIKCCCPQGVDCNSMYACLCQPSIM